MLVDAVAPDNTARRYGTAAVPAGRTGTYSSSRAPNVQATPSRAVRVAGGTRSRYVRLVPSGSGVELTTRPLATGSSSAPTSRRHSTPVPSRCTGSALKPSR